MKRKAGRPKKVGPKLNQRIVFMATKEESSELRRLAATLNLPVAELARRAVKGFVEAHSVQK